MGYSVSRPGVSLCLIAQSIGALVPRTAEKWPVSGAAAKARMELNTHLGKLAVRTQDRQGAAASDGYRTEN